MSIYHIKNLIFSYSNQVADKPVLSVRELVIAKAQKIFVLGPSGSGKSTLLELLAGISNPTQGEILFLDHPFSKLPASERDRVRADHIGYIFQSFNLIPYLSVKENISMPLYISEVRRKKIRESSVEKEVERLARHLGVFELLDRRARDLSVGQQQRVAACRALIGSPELILADEPTSALDYDHREAFLKLLFSELSINDGTLLFVSHDRSLQSMFESQLKILDLKEIQ